MSDQPQVNLNVTDISDAVKVIDHACEQGAFRGWANIRQVLGLRDRLDMFAAAAAAITNPAEEDVGEDDLEVPAVDDENAVGGEEPVAADAVPQPVRQRQAPQL